MYKPQPLLDLFIKIGFLEIDVVDLLDIFLVGLLLYQVYKLLKGSLAFNIFIGLLLVYFVWFVVGLLGMRLLEGILGQFIEVGVIALLIVFQPEIRKFLIYLGRGSVLSRGFSISRLFRKDKHSTKRYDGIIAEVVSALGNLSNSRTGAILVFSETSRLQFYANTGVIMESAVSSKLLESIFEKNTPLHDGAIIISEMKIIAAGCVLPVSDNTELPSRIGMRHKATVGITEQTDAIAFVISEERGVISYARNGRLIQDVSIDEVQTLLNKFYEPYN